MNFGVFMFLSLHQKMQYGSFYFAGLVKMLIKYKEIELVLSERVGTINSNLSVEDISTDFTAPANGSILYLDVSIDTNAAGKDDFVINIPRGMEIRPVKSIAENYSGWDSYSQMQIPVSTDSHYLVIRASFAKYRYVSFNFVCFLRHHSD